jgi:hypothetical protein
LFVGGLSVGVDVDALSGERSSEVVECGEGGVGAVGVGGGGGEDECFEQHHGGAMGGEPAWCPTTGVELRGDRCCEASAERVGDEHDASADVGGVLQEDAYVRMDAAVGEHDDDVIGAKLEQFVGVVGAGVGQRS